MDEQRLLTNLILVLLLIERVCFIRDCWRLRLGPLLLFESVRKNVHKPVRQRRGRVLFCLREGSRRLVKAHFSPVVRRATRFTGILVAEVLDRWVEPLLPIPVRLFILELCARVGVLDLVINSLFVVLLLAVLVC